ncbi:MAG TPA: hypothetical protein ENG54_00025 [Thermofilum sp.]|nr:hypothetical protein [Thermofilum sp.]
MVRCEYCGKETSLPYRCKYCGGVFCVEHILPEKHNCPGLKKALSPDIIKLAEKSPETGRAYEISYAYYPRPKVRRQKLFYRGEVRDLVIAFLSVLLVFFYPWGLTPIGFAGIFLAALLAFVCHELAHKFMAQHYGYYARFTLHPMGLLLTFLSAVPFFPIKIVMPGSVVIYSSYLGNTRNMGIVAAAGPIVNILFSIILLLLPASPITRLAIHLNALVAVFNLIPFGVLDGRKIIAWNPVAWLVLMAASVALFIIVW